MLTVLIVAVVCIAAWLVPCALAAGLCRVAARGDARESSAVAMDARVLEAGDRPLEPSRRRFARSA